MNIIRSIREKTDTAILFYSAGGKDGIALLDMLAGVFDKVICYYMYLIPNLDHVRPYIKWAENHYKNVEVRQIKHYQRDYFDAFGFFKEPDESVKPRRIGDVESEVREETGIKYAFSGMKKADSMNRRLMLNTYPDYENAGKVYPLADWTQRDVLTYMRQKGLPEPVRYSNKASGGIGFNLDCFLWLRKNYPDDLRRIIKNFPMSERILFEYDNGTK